MKQNESWRTKSKRVQAVPEAEATERSPGEQEAEGRQQSRRTVKTMWDQSLASAAARWMNPLAWLSIT